MRLDYNKLTDNEIIELIAQGDNDAMEYMMKKYGGIVKKEIRKVYIIGAETEDLTQEGMIGLFKAVRDYEPDKGAVFSTFATLCIRNQIKTAISASNRKKHIPLNSYISIYAETDEFGSKLAEDLEDETRESNPEAVVLAREQHSVIEAKIKSDLSSFEQSVLAFFLEGLSYTDIALKLEKNEKSIDNALQRIRAKLSRS